MEISYCEHIKLNFIYIVKRNTEIDGIGPFKVGKYLLCHKDRIYQSTNLSKGKNIILYLLTGCVFMYSSKDLGSSKLLLFIGETKQAAPSPLITNTVRPWNIKNPQKISNRYMYPQRFCIITLNNQN